ncbi:MAG: caspase family protein, partial [Caldilineaceae bacterium]|nr:caspase family protein [Caldilineaceae bacterium]
SVVTLVLTKKRQSPVTTIAHPFGDGEIAMQRGDPMAVMENAHALVIGIANYRQLRQLPQVNDAQAIYDLLIDPAHCGYAATNVELLLDEQATQAAIRSALAKLAKRSNADSTILFYLSGHGGQIVDGPHAGEYLLPVDTIYPPEEDLAKSAISDQEFTQAIRALSARKVLLIFDCCHAAGIAEAKQFRLAEGLETGLSDSYYDALQAGRGRVVLASSRSNESSYVMPNAEYGLFTEHLLAGLRGGIASDDGLIRIFDLFEYLQPRVTAVQPNQHPIFKAELEENFPVALYQGGQQGTISKDDEGFRYDAYISYVDREPDAQWVWETLVPQLEAADLRIAVAGDVEEPGVARVVNMERGIQQAKRTVVVLSDAYLADHMADFENTLAQTMGLQEGAYRLLPVKCAPITQGKLPVRLSMLTTLDLSHPYRSEREFTRLVRALQGPLPRR